MSKVLFVPAHVREIRSEATLPAKIQPLMERAGIAEMVKDQVVAIKMHLGGNVGYTTIHPLMVRKVVEFVKKAGGRPFLTDVSWSAYSAAERGYAQETVGCPTYPAAAMLDTYFRSVPVDYLGLKEIQVAGNLADVPVMINLSHAKGHPMCGYGGAIKNLSMGAVTGKTRGDVHGVMGAVTFWDGEACTHCGVCAENCRMSAISFDDKERLQINFVKCNFCGRCVGICPSDAMQINEENFNSFQRAMALATKVVLDTFAPEKVVNINVATQITPFCDCFGMSTQSIVRDVGIFASADIVAADMATLDLIDKEPYIPGTLPDQMEVSDRPGHLFEKIHGKDPYVMVRWAEELGLGSTTYELEEV